MDTLGSRLKYLLEEILHIYPSALNTTLRRSNNYITNIINGQNKNPSPPLFDYLKNRYNVNPLWLKKGEGDIFLPGGKRDNYSSLQMLRAIDELSPEGQSAMWEYLDLLQIRDKYNRILQDK